MEYVPEEVLVGVLDPNSVGSQQYEGYEEMDGDIYYEDEFDGELPDEEEYDWEEVEMEGYGARRRRRPRSRTQPRWKTKAPRRYRKTPRYAIPRPVKPSAISQIAAEKLRAARKIESMSLRPTIDGSVIKPEPFAISSFTGSPQALTLVANAANARSLVGTYTIPTGFRFVFDPDDPYQEVLFTPFTTVGVLDANFIPGDFDVTLESATGGDVRRILHTDTLHMRPGSNISSVGHLRKWQHKFVGVPGDLVRFYFTAAAVFSTTNSVLVARCRAGKIVL